MAPQNIGEQVTVRGEEFRVTDVNNVSHLGSKFFGKMSFDLVRVSDGSTWGYCGKRVTVNAKLSPVATAEPEPEPETCDHRTGQVGCALTTCQGVPVGVDVHTSEPVAAEPNGYETGHAAFGRDLTHAMRQRGLVVTLPTTFESRWDSRNVRNVSGYDMTANGHAVRVLSYESRGHLTRCGMRYAAVYVGGQIISSEQPMWGGADKVGHAIAYAVARHVDTLRAAKVAAERAEVPAPAEVAEPEPVAVAEPGAEIMARAVDAYAAGDLAGALAAVAEGETVAPAYRSAGASGAAYGWAEMRASLPAEPVAPVAEPEPVAEVAEPVAVAEVPAAVAEVTPVAEPVRPEVPAEPEPVAASAVDVHAAILAQLGRAGSVAPSVPAPVRVAVPDTAAAVVAGWAASDMPVPVSPAAPVAEPADVAKVPAWTYAAGMRVRTILKEVRPEVARRMRDGGVKVGRVSIVPDRDARAVAVTLDGVAEGDAPGVWAIVAEVMGGHGFTPAEVAAEV